MTQAATMETKIDQDTLDTLQLITKRHTRRLLFMTVSGAHLYGFPSPDSDYDLRGAHILPLGEFIGIDDPAETLERSEEDEGIELDMVTHDVRKFFRLMLKPNGYVLEQVLSPLVVQAIPEHEDVCKLAKKCFTRHHAYHYLGFARSQKKLFDKDKEKRVKPLLYIYRVLLTGIHLMQEHELEANLPKLNEKFGLSYLPELIEQKVKGEEKGTLENADLEFHAREYERLVMLLEEEHDNSSLRDKPTCHDELDEMLRWLRRSTVKYAY